MTFGDLYYSFPTLHELPYFIPPGLFWRQRAADALLQQLLDQKEIQGAILEIGCGSGFLSRKIAKVFPDNTIYGIDTSQAMISYAGCRSDEGNLKFLHLDFFDIGTSVLRDERFGAIVSLNVWPFLPLERSLRVVREMSRQQARFVAVTYSRTAWSRFHRRFLSRLFRRPLYIHNPDQFMLVLERFGFEGTCRRIDQVEGTYIVSTVLVR
jgi:SAM-dependent methyltransferase